METKKKIVAKFGLTPSGYYVTMRIICRWKCKVVYDTLEELLQDFPLSIFDIHITEHEDITRLQQYDFPF